jgi:DNA-3-methyladenine glycosylase I
VEKVACYDGIKISALLNDPGIVRNQLKIGSAVTNAQAFLNIQEEWGSFSDFIWSFVDGRPIQNAWRSLAEIPAKTSLAEDLSKDLKKRGFRFVGPTIIYAFMQATGMVNDHLLDCFRYPEIVAMSDK